MCGFETEKEGESNENISVNIDGGQSGKVPD
jgi:hypothetical protein